MRANGGMTGWPPGMLQDDCYKLAHWLSSRIDTMYYLRLWYAECFGDKE